ncbi:MAG: efflux transporter, outer rane factor lipoprotein NodT family [Gammaproteobacteria bacterium]|nr:efflux transporter, outer rane factor lipoprotein NodT family [Gammaproteobacteria bacterium]
MSHWRGMMLTALWAAAAGCAGLPPKPHPVKLPSDAPLSDLAAEGGAWPAADWWARYRDPTLDRLVEMALGSSPTLATAHARFDSARESVRIAGAASGAHVEASGDASRQRLSDNGLFPPQLLGFHWYNQYDLGLQASYTFDWWGKQKASVEAAMDQAHAAQADRNAAALMLASSVADTYFGWQADQNRLALAREHEQTIALERGVAAARVRAQLDSADEVLRADSDLAAARERTAALEGSARLRVVALAALVGRAASELPAMTPKPLPPIGTGLPDDVRIDLIARRADLTASRWRVEAAEKNREAARADFFPDISINALAGVQSVDAGKLLKYASRVPAASAAIHLPIFDAGRLKARYGATQADLDAAVAGYQDTLVSAARDVATQAASRAQIEAQRAQRQLAVEAAQGLRRSAAARVRQGVTDPRTELTAADSWIEQRDALLQLDAAALSADIGLQRALGGGYERDDKNP